MKRSVLLIATWQEKQSRETRARAKLTKTAKVMGSKGDRVAKIIARTTFDSHKGILSDCSTCWMNPLFEFFASFAVFARAGHWCLLFPFLHGTNRGIEFLVLFSGGGKMKGLPHHLQVLLSHARHASDGF
jgi:hypothetical protein